MNCYKKIKEILSIFPDNIALRSTAFQVTYKELGEKIELVASILSDGGVKPGDIIAIVSENKPEFVVLILAVWKLGGVILLVDNQLPSQRINYMLKAAEARFLISTNNKLLNAIQIDLKKIIIDYYQNTRFMMQIPDYEYPLAYIFFTSGSTGNPKGVIASHNSLFHFLHWQNHTFCIFPEDKCLQLTRLSFDVILRAVFTALISGAEVVFPDVTDEVTSCEILNLLEKYQISYFHVVPSLMKTWLVQEPKLIECSSLRYIFFAGEKLEKSLVENVRKTFLNKNLELINLYGPTETVLAKCYYRVPQSLDDNYILPVGRPISNTKIHLVIKNRVINTPDEIGEIVIETLYKSEGYLSDRNIFKQIPNLDKYGYYTGDLGFIDKKGRLFVTGRIDEQIKINGVRIEIAEIDYLITSYIPKIIQAATYYNKQTQQLICYFTAKEEISLAEIQNKLQDIIIPEMLPHKFIWVDALLYNSSGKLDRRNLFQLVGIELKNNRVANITNKDLADKLVKIFKEVFLINTVSVDDNFFALGGNSLKAAVIINKIKKELHREVLLRDIFKYPLVGDFANYLQTVTQAKVEHCELKLLEDPLIAEQAVFASYQLLYTNSAEYNVGYAFSLPSIQIKDLFLEKLYQIIEKVAFMNFKIQVRKDSLYYKWSGKPAIEEIFLKDEDDVSYFLNCMYAQPLNIKQHFLRIVIFYHKSTSYILMIFHHTITDGESSFLLFKSMEELIKGNEIRFNNIIFKPEAISEETLNFWSNYLSNYSKTLGFDNLMPKGEIVRSNSGLTLTKVISSDLIEKISFICVKENITEFVFFYSIFAFLCTRFSRTTNTVVGIPMNNRSLYNAGQDTFGCFVKTLPFIVNINDSQSFLDYIQKANKDLLNLLDNVFPESLTYIIHKLGFSKHINVLNLFDFFFSYDYEYIEEIKIEESVIKRLTLHNGTSKFPVSFMLSKLSNSTINMLIEYDSSRYNEEIMNQFIDSYIYLLDNIENIINTPITHIRYARSNQLYKGCKYQYNQNENFINMVLHQVESNPDKVAIKDKDKLITYKQLWEQVSKVSNYLKQDHNNNKSKVVAVLLPKGVNVIISMLAIFDTGLVYLPIDVNLPHSRICVILEDARPDLIICNNPHITYKNKAQCVNIKDILLKSSIPLKNITSLNQIDLGDPAYLLYTSGTQGKPKGILQNHKTIVNLIHHQKSEFEDLSDSSVVAQSASIGFDVSIQEITYSLATGKTLLIIEYEVKTDPNRFWSIIAHEHVNILFIPPAILQLLAEYTTVSLMTELKYVVVAGEALKISSQIRTMFKQYTGCRLINHYGPTETHVVASYLLPKDIDLWPELPSIGFPVLNCGYLVLDENRQIVPVGVVGELFIFGDNLANGYYNNKDLTDSKFIELTVGTITLRLYKSGDLVRQNKDYSLEYIGRNDSQVQINGYRVELSEIESQLLLFPGIRQSKVVVKETLTGNKCLIGYYVSKVPIDEGKLFSFLAKILPEYMMPNYFIQLYEDFPLTINGKIDYKNLPQPRVTINENRASPRNDTEEQICKLWADMLKIPEHEVSIDDDFFRYGGNSLLAIRLVSKINNIFPSSIRLQDFLMNQSISKISNFIKNTAYKNTYEEVAKVTSSDNKYELSYAQQRLWFVDQYTNGTNAYNISLVFKFKSNTNKRYVKLSIQNVIKRHEILHSLVKQDKDGQVYQTVLDDNNYKFVCHDKTLVTHQQFLDELAKDMYYIFDLSAELPFQVNFYRVSDEQYMSIVIHHIAFDGWSIDVFLNELAEYYTNYINNISKRRKIPNLPLISIQYKDFAKWQRQYLNRNLLNIQLSYWKDKLNCYETLNLLTDKPRPVNINYSGDYVYFELNSNTSQQLILLAKLLDVSVYSVLLSAYYLLLGCYSNQKDIVVGTSVSNRHYPQIENLIGFFVNNLALRVIIDDTLTVTEFIKTVGSTVVNAQLHQDVPFEHLVAELKVPKDSSRHPIFQVVFEMLNPHVENPKLGNFLELIDQKIYKAAKFDLTLTMSYNQNKIMGNFNYQISLFEKKSIYGFIQTYKLLLSQFANLFENKTVLKNIMLTDLKFTADAINLGIINRQFMAKYDNAVSVHEIFEKQAQETPYKIALQYSEYSLSYAELNEQANQLAHYLVKKFSINSNRLMAICGRNEYTIISMLAILKAGCAYVPIDITNPEQRIAYIINDTGMDVVLCCSEHIDKLQCIIDEYTKKKPALIDLRKISVRSQKSTNLNLPTNKIDLAYIIYTSGTTGNPKGVMIEQQNVINYLYNVNTLIMSNPDDVVDFSTNIAFDLTVTCTLGALCSGNTINIYINDVRDIQLYKQYLIDNKINIIKVVPSYFELLCDFLPVTRINKVILGGEKVSEQLLEKIKKADLIIIDEYGPTETTVGACFKLITMANYDKNRLHNIGLAYPGYDLHVVDENLRKLPYGAVGELYIGGYGVARGYLNNKELTDKSFVKYNKIADGARLYKSGDLVRVLFNGELEYIGRKDSQVKLNGYRIDLNEIAAKFLQIPFVKQAVAVIKRASNKNLFITAYYTSNHILDQDEIMQRLIAVLPEYMLPKAILWLQEIPLTANGKINEKELPMPEFSSRVPYVEPNSAIEKQIRSVYSEVLHLNPKKISIDADFFAMGGNSIQAIILANRLSNLFGRKIKVTDIFIKRSIKALSELIQLNAGFKLVVKLNSAQGKPKLFMIHPAIGGSEVYQELANNLQDHYSCYGVDSYNLYHESKITNLMQLAQLYLTEVEKVLNSEDETIYLFGWSFGGQIAIEIAGLLEQKGQRKISIILLDTVIFDDKLNNINDSINRDEFNSNFEKYMLTQNHEKLYIDKILKNLNTEFELIKQKVSYKLKSTNILLYKAMLPDVRYNISQSKLMDQYILKLKYNNIDTVIANLRQLITIRLYNAHHGDIMQQPEILSFHQQITQNNGQ